MRVNSEGPGAGAGASAGAGGQIGDGDGTMATSPPALPRPVADGGPALTRRGLEVARGRQLTGCGWREGAVEEPVAVALAARKHQKAQRRRRKAQRPEMTERGRGTLSKPGGANWGGLGWSRWLNYSLECPVSTGGWQAIRPSRLMVNAWSDTPAEGPLGFHAKSLTESSQKAPLHPP